MKARIAIALVVLSFAPSAKADEGCACNKPRNTVPIYGAKAFGYAELARVAGPPPPKGPGGTNCAAAAERVRGFYRERGFARAEVTYEPLMSGDCALRVAEGRRFVVRRVTFIGNPPLEDRAVRRAVVLAEGGDYDEGLIAQSLARLGRIEQLQPVRRDDVEVEMDDARGTVDVTFRLRERE
jgi:hypothetical protein